MSRLLFPDEGSRLAYRVSGTPLRSVANSPVTVYTDDAGTVLADIREYDGTNVPGPVIAGSVVTTDAYSRLPLFWGPEQSVKTLYAIIYGGPVSPVSSRFQPQVDQILAGYAADPYLLAFGAMTRDANGAPLTGPVVWPDGTVGVYTTTTVSATWPGAVDAYTITYGSPVIYTYTQPAVTRNASGFVTLRPVIVVT